MVLDLDEMCNCEAKCHEVYVEFGGGDNSGELKRSQFKKCIEALVAEELTHEQLDVFYDEFDKDVNGTIDFREFQDIVEYVRDIAQRKKRTKSSMADLLEDVVKAHQKDNRKLLRKIAKKIYPYRDVLCVQGHDIEDKSSSAISESRSMSLDFDDVFRIPREYGNKMDADFDPAFSASDMKCLALVSHNGMKKTMREFVMANKNLLKKFRLTGTNSTMTMLKEVFKDEPAGRVVFGPTCASGPLGGDAELVAHMVSGKIGGIIFFQDPMDAHPHRVDIDCLVRQALVYNVMMAMTPTSALMQVHCLRQALMGEGKPEMIPSFFFALQSPTVEAYKKQQKAVVDNQKALAKNASSSRMRASAWQSSQTNCNIQDQLKM